MSLWQSLLEAWAFFGPAWVSGVLLAALLPLAGLYVLAREQVFAGAALSQASALGIALALVLLGGGHADEGGPLALGAGLAVAAALFIQAAPSLQRDARAGWVFVAGGAGSLLVLAGSPLGQEEVRRLLSSSLLGAGAGQALGLGVLAAFVALWVARRRRRWTLALLDPDFAASAGVDPRRFERAAAVGLALLLTLAVRQAGFLFAFAALLLPAVAARRLSRRALPLWWLAPLLGALTAALGFVWGHWADLPPGLCAAMVMVGSAGLSFLKRND